MEIREAREQNTATIRTLTPVEKLPEVMGRCYGEIMQHLGPRGLRPAGPPFAAYHNMDMSNLDVEIGFPVAARVEAGGRVKASRLPGGRAAVAVHAGPYDRIEETYNRLAAFVKEKGLQTGPVCWEVYLNDPAGTPPEQLRTEIWFPLRETGGA